MSNIWLLPLTLTETWPFYHSPWMVHLGEHEELAASELGTYRDKLCGSCERSVCLCACVYYQDWRKSGSRASWGTIQKHHFGVVLYVLCMYVCIPANICNKTPWLIDSYQTQASSILLHEEVIVEVCRRALRMMAFKVTMQKDLCLLNMCRAPWQLPLTDVGGSFLKMTAWLVQWLSRGA